METLLTHWITEYGYWATFFGTMIEGETAAFLSGIAAHHQLLSYPKVMLVAALGGIISDNVLFLPVILPETGSCPAFINMRIK